MGTIVDSVIGFLFSIPKSDEFEGMGVSTEIGVWATKNANKADADGLIAAAMAESIVKHFNKWKAVSFTDPKKAWMNGGEGCLINSEKGITLKRLPENKGDKYRFNGMVLIHPKGELALSSKAERFIITAYEKISVKVQAAEKAAKIAKDNMDRLDRAWNIAEDLLGFKREENGALVPQKTAE